MKRVNLKWTSIVKVEVFIIMEFLKSFITTYGMTILYVIFTAIAGFIGMQAKKLYEKICDDNTKKSVVRTCVQAVEQIYTDLHGEEKYNKCAEAISEMLNEKGITISDIEIKMLVEASVAEFNKAFEQTTTVKMDDYSKIEKSTAQNVENN